MNPREIKPGVLPSQMIASATKDGWIAASDGTDIPDENIQPASLDLRLGSVAYRLRCSFLPDNEPVEEALRRYKADRAVSIRQGFVLEQGRPYLIPLVEQLDLPDEVRAKANPKSSTGRLDIFTRVISDNSFMFDEVPAGYRGRLYLEVVSRTFPIRVWPGLSLNQLRLLVGQTSLSDDEIRELHGDVPLLFRDTAEKFYLLLSQDSLRIPPDYAAEMTAYDPTSGELRTHYAGFFDPGFGDDTSRPESPGSRAALEVRAHDVPFAIEHGQNICKLSFDRMSERPDRLYGAMLDSNYQGQEVALSKHFRREKQEQAVQHEIHTGPEQPGLFPIEEALPNGHAATGISRLVRAPAS